MTKKEFNQSFKLEVNGKFVGCENPIVNTALLFHKVDKLLRKEQNRMAAPVSYPVSMRVSGQNIKLYAW